MKNKPKHKFRPQSTLHIQGIFRKIDILISGMQEARKELTKSLEVRLEVADLNYTPDRCINTGRKFQTRVIEHHDLVYLHIKI